MTMRYGELLIWLLPASTCCSCCAVACGGTRALLRQAACNTATMSCIRPDAAQVQLAACRFGINLFTRIPLSAGTVFVGALVYGVRKYDLVNGGRTYPPYALYYSWGDLPGFTVVPAVQQVLH